MLSTLRFLGSGCLASAFSELPEGVVCCDIVDDASVELPQLEVSRWSVVVVWWWWMVGEGWWWWCRMV